jgi:hypothetical protein
MRTTVKRSLELLREADPARDLAPVESGAVDAALRTARDSGVASDLTSAAPSRHGRGRVVLAVVAAAVVAGVSIAVAVVPHDSTHASGDGSPTAANSSPAPTSTPTLTPTATSTSSPVSTFPSFGPTGTLGTSDDPNFAPTLKLVEQGLASVPTLPGATPVDRAPATALTEARGYSEDGNLIDRAAFWTAPGTLSDAVAYFKANPPTGTTLTGDGTSSNTNSSTVVEENLTFAEFGTNDTQSAEITMSIVPLDRGVGVRADAVAIWIPTKPAAEHIGAVTSVDITINRLTAAATVRKTLTGAAAQRLADAVDALQVATPGVWSCPTDRGFSDALVFHAPGRTIHALDEVGGCGGVALLVNGVVQPELSGSVDAQVTAALGLPTGYGD